MREENKRMHPKWWTLCSDANGRDCESTTEVAYAAVLDDELEIKLRVGTQWRSNFAWVRVPFLDMSEVINEYTKRLHSKLKKQYAEGHKLYIENMNLKRDLSSMRIAKSQLERKSSRLDRELKTARDKIHQLEVELDESKLSNGLKTIAIEELQGKVH